MDGASAPGGGVMPILVHAAFSGPSDPSSCGRLRSRWHHVAALPSRSDGFVDCRVATGYGGASALFPILRLGGRNERVRIHPAAEAETRLSRAVRSEERRVGKEW